MFPREAANRRRFPPELELLRVCTPCPPKTLPINAFILTTYGTPRRNYGLAIPLQMRKELRGKIKLVRTLSSSPFAYPQTAHNHSPSVFAGRIASEKRNSLTALNEYETASVHSTTPTRGIGLAQTRRRPEGARIVRVVCAFRSRAGLTMAHNPTRPQRKAEPDQLAPTPFSFSFDGRSRQQQQQQQK